MGQAAPFAFRTSVSAAGPTPAIPNLTALRREIEDQIERLIAALDMMDGDTDMELEHDDEELADDEDGADDEPSLGYLVMGGPSAGLIDVEAEEGDEEPSLGWPERLNQLAPAGGSDDREREPSEASWS